jgi:hypothetical protein
MMRMLRSKSWPSEGSSKLRAEVVVLDPAVNLLDSACLRYGAQKHQSCPTKFIHE